MTGSAHLADAAFDAAWALAEPVPGWLTPEQARALWDVAVAVPAGGLVVEIGSHQGRSTIVLAAAARRVGATVAAVDPFVEGPLFGGAATRERFERNLVSAQLMDLVELIPHHSTRLRPGWHRRIDVLYVDGKHDYWTCRDDLRWNRHLVPGGRLLVHDAFSSIGVTSALVVDALALGRIRYLNRVASLASFEATPATMADRAAVVRQLPWFLRNVVVKVLLRLGLRPLARLLGHTGRYDPY